MAAIAYSEAIRRRAAKAENRGRLAAPTHAACWGNPGRGPFMLLHLGAERGRIARVLFDANDCPVAIACGSALAELVQGRALAELHALGREDITRLVGVVPAGKTYCLDVAAELIARIARRGSV